MGGRAYAASAGARRGGLRVSWRRMGDANAARMGVLERSVEHYQVRCARSIYGLVVDDGDGVQVEGGGGEARRRKKSRAPCMHATIM